MTFCKKRITTYQNNIVLSLYFLILIYLYIFGGMHNVLKCQIENVEFCHCVLFLISGKFYV